VSVPGGLAPGDRLFAPGNTAPVANGALSDSPIAHPPLEPLADPAALATATLHIARTPARNPFADASALPAAGLPDPTVHSLPALDSGTATALVLQHAPGRVVGLHATVPADAWRNTPVLRAQVEAGLLGSPVPPTCQPPHYVDIAALPSPNGVHIDVNPSKPTAVLADLSGSFVQFYEDTLMDFMDEAVGGRPDTTCNIDLSNTPCVVRENDYLQPSSLILGDCPPTPRVVVSTTPLANPTADDPVVVEPWNYQYYNYERYLKWLESALLDFAADGYGGLPTTTCNMPIDNAPCVLAAGDDSGDGSFDCADTSIIGSFSPEIVACPAYILPVYIFDEDTGIGTDYLVRVQDSGARGWIMWPVSSTSIRTQPELFWAREQKGRHLFARNPLTCAGCEACTTTSILASSQGSLTPIQTLRCYDSLHPRQQYLGCPAYVLDVVGLDPTTGTQTAYKVRAHETQHYGWLLWRLVDNNLLNSDGTIQFGDGLRGHRLYVTDPLATSGCSLPEVLITPPPRNTAAHMALLVTDRALLDSEWDSIICGRLRGSIECDVGHVVDADSGSCVPCTAATCAHLGAEYSLCSNGVDPDDTDGGSANAAPDALLAGIVAPLGRGDAMDGCSHVHPRVTVAAIDRGQHTDAVKACCTPEHPAATRLDLPGRIAHVPFADASALWGGVDDASLPPCVQSINTSDPGAFVPLDGETTPLPCRTTATGAFPASGATAATIFTRAFVLGRGYVLLAVDAGDVVDVGGFRHRRLAEAFAVVTEADAVADLNGNLPNQPHVFAVGENVWAFNARAGKGAETCRTDPLAQSRHGVTQFVLPPVDTAALPSDKLHIYQLFLVGDTTACASAACVEAAAPAPAPFVHEGERLVLFPGSALWLDVGKAPPFALTSGCLTVDFAGTTRDGAFFEVLPHATPAHLGGQTFTAMDVCGSATPCQLTDSNTGIVWYHLQVFKSDGSTVRVALRTDAVGDDPDAAGTIYVGYIVSDVGVGTDVVDAGAENFATGQQLFLTDSLQCGAARRRRRSLLQARTVPALRQATAQWRRRAPEAKPAQVAASVLVHREVVKARLEKKQRRQHAVLASRHLLQTGSDQSESESASTTTLRRTVLGADAAKSILQATCEPGVKMCVLLEVELVLPTALYCLSSTELVERKQAELLGVFMRASGQKLKGVRVTSVYREDFVQRCVQSTGARRLLAAGGNALVDVVTTSDNTDVRMQISNSDITLAGIQKVREMQHKSDGSREFSLCVGDDECKKNATLSVKPTTTTTTSSNDDDTDNSSTVLFIVLISVVGVVIVVAGVYLLVRSCRRDAVDAPTAELQMPAGYVKQQPPMYGVDAGIGYANPGYAYPQPQQPMFGAHPAYGMVPGGC